MSNTPRVLVIALPIKGFEDAVGFAQKLSPQASITVFTAGEVSSKAFRGIDKVLKTDAEDPLPEQVAEFVQNIAGEYDALVAPSFKDSTEILARVSARLGIPMFTEVNSLEKGSDGSIYVKRPVIAGRAYVKYKATLPAAFTVAKKSFPPESGEGTPLVEAVQLPQPRSKRVSVEDKKFSGVNIEEAEVVIGVGRGFRKKEDLAMAEELAKLLNGAVGCSRPITADLGWLPEDAWIGISGKRIRPKLYMPIGISGAPQHMSAAIDSKVIIAINKDKGAPVFQYADYGFVIDLYKLLPVLIEKLKERKKA